MSGSLLATYYLIASCKSYKKERREEQNHKPISFSCHELNFVKVLHKQYVFQAKITW